MSMSPPTEPPEPPEPPTEVREPSSGNDDDIRTRLKRTLWGSRPRRIISVVVALLVVLVAVGGIADALNGGSEPSSSATNLPEPTTTETNGTPEANGFSGEGCTSGPAEANVRVTIYGGETCAEWDKTQSSSGTFWRETSPLPYSDNAQLLCSMEGPGGQTLIEVRDTGEHSYGNRICALLTSEGWHKTEGPGEKLEQSRKAHEAKVSGEAREAEKPKLEAAASTLNAEAAALHKKQHQEEALAKHDEAESKRLEHEEPAEGNGSKNAESGSLNEDSGTHEEQAGSFKAEAETKESEANEDLKKASED